MWETWSKNAIMSTIRDEKKIIRLRKKEARSTVFNTSLIFQALSPNYNFLVALFVLQDGQHKSILQKGKENGDLNPNIPLF